MKLLQRLLPWGLLALFVVEMVVVMLPRRDGEFHILEFGRLPVLLNGRIQPFDSVARNSLLQLRSTGDLPIEEVPGWKFWHHPRKLKSTEWLLEVMFRPADADQRPVFLIHHPDLINELKLTGKGVAKSGLHYYSYEEIAPVIDEINKQGRQASQLEDAQRTAYQKQVIKIANAVWLYQRLKNSIQPESMTDFSAALAAYKAALPAGVAALRDAHGTGKSHTETLKQLAPLAQQFNNVAQYAYPLVVPPANPADKEGWLNIGVSLIGSLRDGQVHPAVDAYARIASAYGQRDAAAFNAAVAAYRDWLAPQFSREVAKGRSEHYYNQIKLFLHATIIYIVVFVLAGGALLTFAAAPGTSEALRRSAYYLVWLALIVHTFGLVYRMLLEGRPPVTNLYSSAIFIGWGTCVLGLILERLYRVGLGSAVAGLAGFITLLIAHNLALGGDTMEMLRAVLDTNFWLATHVVTITLGYSAMFVAGALGLAYVILGLFTPLLRFPVAGKTDLQLGKALANMTYAVICFAMFFSFIGTVLGGIWADQSWGRFWGWDPKENGALLIVIWCAIILHARWGGIARDRGLMNLAIFGNIITAFSWFGTNMLGIGLHSYGFMDAAFNWLMIFVLSQLAVIAAGSLPLPLWKSFRLQTPPVT